MGIAQAKIITNCRELLDEDEDNSKRKHNSKMPWIVPTKKLYHERRGKPSPIGITSRSCTNGQVVPINNGDGGPFGRGGNGPPIGSPLGGSGNGPLGGGDNGLLGDQNSRPYAAGLTWPWNRAYLEFVVPFMVSYPTPYNTKSSTK